MTEYEKMRQDVYDPASCVHERPQEWKLDIFTDPDHRRFVHQRTNSWEKYDPSKHDADR